MEVSFFKFLEHAFIFMLKFLEPAFIFMNDLLTRQSSRPIPTRKGTKPQGSLFHQYFQTTTKYLQPLACSVLSQPSSSDKHL